MKKELIQNLKERCLVLEEDAQYREDYRYHMLRSNHIKGVLPCRIQTVDASLKFTYEIGSALALREYPDTYEVDREFVMELLTAIWKLEESLRAYLLRMENVLLDIEYIYWQEGTFFFCYLPVYEKPASEAIHELLLELHEQTDPGNMELRSFLQLLIRQTEEPFLLEEVIRKVKDEPADLREEWNPSYQDGRMRYQNVYDQFFDELLPKDTQVHEVVREEPLPSGGLFSMFRREERELKRAEKEQRKIEKYEAKEQRRADKEAARQERKAARLSRQELRLKEKEERLKEKKELLEERQFQEEIRGLEEDPATVYLYQEDLPHRLTLHRIDGSDHIIIDESPFYIGSDDSGYVQGYIPNPVVSKRHAQILSLAGVTFLEDLGSTNHTYHNGHKLDIGERVRLTPGDHILFANLEYRVFAAREDT